ncbi:hypothetical protein [Erwinia mallotivora]|uniref:hypothetical protein n=1 Tax=Erwinia mallotivora TaxID=69222 RepID=UPI0021BEE9C2|nr:hypothetical protein [Erwinia mallotivora]
MKTDTLTFSERVHYVIALTGTALLAAAFIWNYYGNRMFGSVADNPALTQDNLLALSAMLHLPTWALLVVGATLILVASVAEVVSSFVRVIAGRRNG